MSSARLAIDIVTMFLCRMRKHSKFTYGSIVNSKVNLGCGFSIAHGWLNIDGSLNSLVSKWPQPFLRIAYRYSGSSQFYSFSQFRKILAENIFIHYNLEYGIPLPNESAQFIYTSHFLEHLTLNDGKKLLRESYRVLKPKGILRVVIPDLEFAIKLYSEGQKTRMLNEYFFVDHDGSYFARHKYMYDFKLIELAMNEVGFNKIERFAFQQGRVPDLKILDNRPDDSLYVESTK